MQEKTVAVEIEICTNCKSHAWCTRHDEKKYEGIFEEILKAVAAKDPHVKIEKKLASDKKMGAFEITSAGKLLFSKLAYAYFPNTHAITERITNFAADLRSGKDVSHYDISHELHSPKQDFDKNISYLQEPRSPKQKGNSGSKKAALYYSFVDHSDHKQAKHIEEIGVKTSLTKEQPKKQEEKKPEVHIEEKTVKQQQKKNAESKAKKAEGSLESRLAEKVTAEKKSETDAKKDPSPVKTQEIKKESQSEVKKAQLKQEGEPAPKQPSQKEEIKQQSKPSEVKPITAESNQPKQEQPKADPPKVQKPASMVQVKQEVQETKPQSKQEKLESKPVSQDKHTPADRLEQKAATKVDQPSEVAAPKATVQQNNAEPEAKSKPQELTWEARFEGGNFTLQKGKE